MGFMDNLKVLAGVVSQDNIADNVCQRCGGCGETYVHKDGTKSLVALACPQCKGSGHATRLLSDIDKTICVACQGRGNRAGVPCKSCDGTGQASKSGTARDANLSYPCNFVDVQRGNFAGDFSELDRYLNQGQLTLTFVATEMSTKGTQSLTLSIKPAKLKPEIDYCLNNVPIIIKPKDQKYLTLRGLVSGMYSACRDGKVLGNLFKTSSAVLLTALSVHDSKGHLLIQASLVDKK